MATTEKAVKVEKIAKAPVSIGDRMKAQLNAAVLRNKITVDELSDLEQHIKKIAGFLG